MTRVHIITLCHMLPEIIAFSLTKAVRTMGFKTESWTIVDHHWPIDPLHTSDLVRRITGIPEGDRSVRRVMPPMNLGGHGGWSFAMKGLRAAGYIEPGDLILTYDPDTNPPESAWLKAMVEVMDADPTLDVLSLMLPWIEENRPWNFREVAGHRLASHPHLDMYNTTIWRESTVRDGFHGTAEFYGGVESAMWAGRKHAYLYDVREAACPIPHHPLYVQWKLDHFNHRYAGNFDQYVRERQK